MQRLAEALESGNNAVHEFNELIEKHRSEGTKPKR